MSELQAAWDEREAEVQAAGLPVRSVPRGLQVTDTTSAKLVVAAIQAARLAAANSRAQGEAMAAVAERYADWLGSTYAVQLQAVVRAETGERGGKSIKLLTGVTAEPAKVGFRTAPGGLRIVDAEAAVAWAREQFDPHEADGFVRVPEPKPSPIAAKFKQWYEDTGECPPGCIVQEPEERFTIS